MTLSLRGKIVFMCVMIALFGGFVSAFGIYNTAVVTETYGHVGGINLPNAEALGGMKATQKDLVINAQAYLNGQNTKEKIQNLIEDYEKVYSWYQTIPFVPGEDELYQKMAKSWKAFKEEINRITSSQSAGTNLMPLSADFDRSISDMIKFQTDEGDNWSRKAEKAAAFTRMIQIICLLVMIGLSLVSSFIFGKKIAERVQATILKLEANSQAVSSASSQIAASSQSLSEATTEQASALQQTTSALEEITTMISKSVESAHSSSKSAIESKEKAEAGRSAVEKMLHSMSEISHGNEETFGHVMESTEKMIAIKTIIEEIATKTRVINDIVFQTKLLSFNASVEAARAGEHGKGFSVVAEEVGNLAQMSGNAAKEIGDLLQRSTQTVEQTVTETKARMEQLVAAGKERVAVGMSSAESCASILEEIVSQAAHVSELSTEITRANKEQSQGVTEINKAMAQLDQVTQQNASTSEEAATAAGSLSEQATILKESVLELLAVIEGKAVNSPAPQPRYEIRPKPRVTHKSAAA
jgi:methyl-accepting chemotaxis protein